MGRIDASEVCLYRHIEETLCKGQNQTMNKYYKNVDWRKCYIMRPKLGK